MGIWLNETFEEWFERAEGNPDVEEWVIPFLKNTNLLNFDNQVKSQTVKESSMATVIHSFHFNGIVKEGVTLLLESSTLFKI